MIRNLLLVSLIWLSFGVLAQQNRQYKALFLELGGSAGLGSINYEQGFGVSGPVTWNWRAGLSFLPVDKNNGTAFVFPVLIEAIIGKQAHHVELGLGQGFTVTTKGKFFALATPVVGYRYQNADKPWFFRAGYTPLVSYILDLQVQHWAGVSLGYSLQKKDK